MGAMCRRRSSMSAGHEPFAVEHCGHDAPGEQVDGHEGVPLVACPEPTPPTLTAVWPPVEKTCSAC
jgi:hypothetical protein